MYNNKNMTECTCSLKGCNVFVWLDFDCLEALMPTESSVCKTFYAKQFNFHFSKHFMQNHFVFTYVTKSAFQLHFLQDVLLHHQNLVLQGKVRKPAQSSILILLLGSASLWGILQLNPYYPLY